MQVYYNDCTKPALSHNKPVSVSRVVPPKDFLTQVVMVSGTAAVYVHISLVICQAHLVKAWSTAQPCSVS